MPRGAESIMDIATLSFALAVVGLALAVLTGVFASFRGDRGLTIYAFGFVCAVVSFLLFMSQRFLPKALSIVAANMLLVLYQLSLAWGLRARFFAKPGWPPRFSAYLAVWFAILCYATWASPSFTLRAGVSSIFVLAGCVEFLIALKLLPKDLSLVIKRAAKTIVISFLAFHSARFIIILTMSSPQTRLLDAEFVNIFSFAVSLFFSVLWAGLIMAIDAADLLLKVQEQNRALATIAATDELTGLSNRYRMDAAISAEVDRATRYDEPLSLIIFDLDHFKRVNDTWGHETGDRVLKRVAEAVKGIVRKPDELFRWGGEEFLVLAPHTTLEGAVSTAEKLRAAVKSERIPDVGTVSASFGVAQLWPGESASDWFKRADRALYRAKNQGRNRVVSLEFGEPAPVASVTIKWRPEWDSGNKAIDEDHTRLVELSNELLDLGLSKTSIDDTLRAVDELIAHVARHFGNEEAMLARAGYPDAEAHAAQHRELILAANELRSAVASGGAEPVALFDFLVNKVVIGHMAGADALYFPYVRDATGSMGTVAGDP